MPPFGLIKQKDLVRNLKFLGFDGPYSGGKYPFMIKGTLTIAIPNPHRSQLGKELLSRILKQASISREDWENI